MRIMDKVRSCTFSFLLPILIINTGVLAVSSTTTLPTSYTAHQSTRPSPSSDVLAAYPSTPSFQPPKFSSQTKSVPLSLPSSEQSSSVTPVLSIIIDATSTMISSAVNRPDKPSYVSSLSRFENAETSTIAVVSTAVAKLSQTNSAELSTNSKTEAKSSSVKGSSVTTPTSIETGETRFLKFTPSPILTQSRSVSPTSSTKTNETKSSTTTPSAHLDESSSVTIGVADSVKFTSSPTPLPSSDETPSSKPLTTTYLAALGDSSSEEYSQPDSTAISPVSSPTSRKSTSEPSSWSIEIKSSAIAPGESLGESSSVLFYLPSDGTPTGAVTVTTSSTPLKSSNIASPSRIKIAVTATSSPISQKSVSEVLTLGTKISNVKPLISIISTSLGQSRSVPSYSQPESTATRLDTVTSSPTSEKSSSVTLTSRSRTADFKSSTTTSSARLEDSSSVPSYSHPESTGLDIVTSSPTSGKSDSVTSTSKAKIAGIKSSALTSSTSQEESSTVLYFSPPDSTTTSATSSPTSLQSRNVTPSSVTRIDYIKSSMKAPSAIIGESSNVPSYSLPESTTTSEASFTSSPTSLQSRSVTPSSMIKTDYIKSSIKTPSASVEESSSVPSYSPADSTTTSAASLTSSPTSLQSSSTTLSSITKIDYIKSSTKTPSASIEESSSVSSYSLPESTTTSTASFTSSPTPPKSRSVTLSSVTKIDYIKSSMKTPSASIEDSSRVPSFSLPESTKTSVASFTSSPTSLQSRSVTPSSVTRIDYVKSSIKTPSASLEESSSVPSYSPAGSTTTSATSSPTSLQSSSKMQTSRTKTAYIKSSTTTPSASQGESGSVPPHSQPDSTPTSPMSFTSSPMSRQFTSSNVPLKITIADKKSSTITSSASIGESSGVLSYLKPGSTPTSSVNYTSSPTSPHYSSVPPSSRTKTTDRKSITIRLSESLGESSSVAFYSHPQSAATSVVTATPSLTSLQPRSLPPSSRTKTTDRKSSTFSPSERLRESSGSPSFSLPQAGPTTLVNFTSSPTQQQFSSVAPSSSDQVPLPLFNKTTLQRPATIAKTITTSFPTFFSIPSQRKPNSSSVSSSAEIGTTSFVTLPSSEDSRQFTITTRSRSTDVTQVTSETFASSPHPRLPSSVPPSSSSVIAATQSLTKSPSPSTEVTATRTATSTSRSAYIPVVASSSTVNVTVKQVDLTMNQTITRSRSSISFVASLSSVKLTYNVTVISLPHSAVQATLSSSKRTTRLFNFTSTEVLMTTSTVSSFSAAKSSDSLNFTSSQSPFISEISSMGSLRPTESSMTFRKDQTTLRQTLSTIAFPSISTTNSTDRSIHLTTTRSLVDMSPSKKESLSLSTAHATLSLSSQILSLFSTQNFTMDQTAKIPRSSTSVRPTITTVKATPSFVSQPITPSPSTTTSIELSLSSLTSKTSVSGDLSSTAPSPLSSEVVSTASLTLQKTSQYISARVPSRTGVSMSSAMISIPSLIQTRSALVSSEDVKITSVSAESSTSLTSQRQSSSFSPSSRIKSILSQSFTLLTTQTISSTEPEITVPSSSSTKITLPSFSSPVSSVSSPLAVIETPRSVASVSSPPSAQWTSLMPSLSTGIVSIRSETSSKAKTSQMLRLSTRASRSFSMDMYVTSSSLLSRTAPISMSPQPTSASTTSVTSVKTEPEPSPSQSIGVTPTTTISLTTKNPEVGLKTFNVTMTITNRDYNSRLADKESKEFQNLATEVQVNVNNALKGIYSSEVDKFLEANSVICQLKILVLKDSNITKEIIKVSLEKSKGSLNLTDVTVEDTEMPTTKALTDKKTPTKPTAKTMTKKPTKDDVVFQVTAKIPNENYTDELGNVSSERFKKLSKDIADFLTNIFDSNLPGFLGVEVVRFQRGSIICTFNIRTKEESTVSEKDIKEVLTDATGENSKYAFKDIEVKRKPVKMTTKPYETPTTKSTETVAVFRVTIANEIYTEELADSTSVQFKKLSKELTVILTDIFKNKVSGFRRVEIISFRKGSVICVFKVITEESKASVDKIKDVLTEASKNGKAGKYTFKDVNVEQQQTAEVTNPQENNNWPAWATAIIAVFGVLLLVIFIIIYVIYRRLKSGSADLPNHDKDDVPLKDLNPGSPTIHHRNSEPTERTSFLSESRMEE